MAFFLDLENKKGWCKMATGTIADIRTKDTYAVILGSEEESVDFEEVFELIRDFVGRADNADRKVKLTMEFVR